MILLVLILKANYYKLSGSSSTTGLMFGEQGYVTWMEARTIMYLKISISDFLTLFSARTRVWFWERRPGYALGVACIVATGSSTLLSLFWDKIMKDQDSYMKGLNGSYACLSTWAYCVAWFVLQDICKVLTYKMLEALSEKDQQRLARAELRAKIAAIIDADEKAKRMRGMISEGSDSPAAKFGGSDPELVEEVLSLKKQVEQPVMDSSVWGVRPSDSPAGMCGEMAASWFRKWAELVGCYPPNAATSIQIHIDAKTKTTIWGLFVLEQPDYAISYQHFAKVMDEEAARPPKICMRHKKDVSSACSDCIRLNENLAAALESRDFNHIEAAKKVLAAHCERVRQERRFYMDTITQASYSPAPLLSCVWDIMDQKKCNFPNWKGPLALAMAGAQRMPLKLLGFTWHGDRWYGFTAPPWVPKGANLTCSAVYLALLDAKERRARLPPVLKICIDGGSENWNHTTFSFFSHLVTIRVFSEVWIFRMPVGHTHNDQDQKYSRISVGLHGADSMDTGCASLTPDEWTETLRNSFLMEQAKPHMKWLSSVFDFDAFYHSSQACLKGYGASTQYTRVGTEEARLEEEKRSHFRYVPPLRS